MRKISFSVSLFQMSCVISQIRTLTTQNHRQSGVMHGKEKRRKRFVNRQPKCNAKSEKGKAKQAKKIVKQLHQLKMRRNEETQNDREREDKKQLKHKKM